MEKTRLIVRLNDKPYSLQSFEKIASKYEAKTAGKVPMRGEVKTVVVELTPSLVSSFIGDVQQAGLITYIEPSMKIQAMLVPNNQYWSWQWGPTNRIKDVAVVSRAFGKLAGMEGYNWEADINGNFKVDIFDGALVSRSFGNFY